MLEFILWGATGQAIVLEELLSSQNSKIVALFENNKAVTSPFSHIPLFYGKEGFEGWLLKEGKKEKPHFLVAIGGSHGDSRAHIFKYLESIGLTSQTVIHPTAFVAYNAQMGRGCQILAQSSVCAKAILGDSVIINTGASIDHETVIGDFVHIAPRATICGAVNIGKHTFIGANSTVLPRITIGENSIIGAGSVVTKNIPNYVVAYGNPAKIIKTIAY
jgi:sugar O-acyltransferase (sialic acid O-acetyltransferase NeuD family)